MSERDDKIVSRYHVLFEYGEAEICRTCLKAVCNGRNAESERHNGEVLEYTATTPGYCAFDCR